MPLANVCGQLSDCQTIDFTREEALDNARKAFQGASDHETTEMAVDNLLSEQRVMIVGHGFPGTIITGTGEDSSDGNSRISLDNPSIWERDVLPLRGEITELTLCSCETGAGPNGANLLADIANEVNARVSGFTGLIFIDSSGVITCEKGGVWQHADPGFTPPPIPAPRHFIGGNMVSKMSLRLKDKGEYRTFAASQVSEITYSVPQKLEGSKKGKEPEERRWKPKFSLPGSEAQRLVSTVNFANPEELKSTPLAVPTARLDIEVKINQGARVWRFTVFNNRLLQDQEAREVFYFASPDFIKQVREHLEPPHHEQTPPQGEQKPPQGEQKPPQGEWKPPDDKKR